MNVERGFRRLKVLVRPTQATMDAKRSRRHLDFALADEQRWNHSTHYHHVLVDAVPRGAVRALDVGCGEGLLTRQLAMSVTNVTGIDPDETSIERARQQANGSAQLEYVVGDIRTHPFELGSFDVVMAVNSIHHIDTRQALTLLGALAKPCGIVGIIGLCRRRILADSPHDGLMFITHLLRFKPNQPWDHGAPMKVPNETFAEIKQLAAELLPGCRYRRHILGRYSVVWHKPTNSG